MKFEIIPRKVKSVISRIGFGGIIWLESLLSLTAQRAYAQNFNITQPSDIGKQILCPIANAMFWVLVVTSTIMVLYAAWLYVISRGEDERVSTARRTITYAGIAIVVALLAKGFPALIGSIFGQPVSSGC